MNRQQLKLQCETIFRDDTRCTNWQHQLRRIENFWWMCDGCFEQVEAIYYNQSQQIPVYMVDEYSN